MQKIRALMEAGAYAEAARTCCALLKRNPNDYEVKLLLGTCWRLLGDDQEFERIDDEIAALPAKRRPAGWKRYHALRAAALGTALVLASSLMPGTASGCLNCVLYGGPDMCRTVEYVPVPTATDGTHKSYVKLTWKEVGRAAYYKIRRATTPNYAKSKVIAKVTKTTYKDKDASCKPGKKYYYWVCPYNVCGQGLRNSGAYDAGYAKFHFDLVWPQHALTVGEKFRIGVSSGCVEVKGTSCKWKIISGASRASISKNGVLTAKKAGSVVVTVSYKGKTKKKTIRIVKSLPVTKYGVACYRDSATEYSDRDGVVMFVMPPKAEA